MANRVALGGVWTGTSSLWAGEPGLETEWIGGLLEALNLFWDIPPLPVLESCVTVLFTQLRMHIAGY